MKWVRRLTIAGGIFVGLFVAYCASQIGYVQYACTPQKSSSAASAFDINDANYVRAEGDSFLTYPEWYIVYAYSDLAGVTKASSESSYQYYRSITGFWSSLCGARQATSSDRPASENQMITDYVIGASFTLEMAIQGLYEKTIGAITVALRGDERTHEDIFNQNLLTEYAKFLEQTPWYRFPFTRALHSLWHDVPFEFSFRSVERRLSLSLQYGVKSIYAKAIGALAGLAPAKLEIGSVVIAASNADLPSNSEIKPVRTLQSSDGRTGILLITPRYRAFTRIIREIGGKGISFEEIAGNTRILTTVLIPNNLSLTLDGVTPIFETTIQSMPGWRRVGYDTKVSAVAALPAIVEAKGAKFEHAYDY